MVSNNNFNKFILKIAFKKLIQMYVKRYEEFGGIVLVWACEPLVDWIFRLTRPNWLCILLGYSNSAVISPTRINIHLDILLGFFLHFEFKVYISLSELQVYDKNTSCKLCLVEENHSIHKGFKADLNLYWSIHVSQKKNKTKQNKNKNKKKNQKQKKKKNQETLHKDCNFNILVVINTASKSNEWLLKTGSILVFTLQQKVPWKIDETKNGKENE